MEEAINDFTLPFIVDWRESPAKSLILSPSRSSVQCRRSHGAEMTSVQALSHGRCLHTACSYTLPPLFFHCSHKGSFANTAVARGEEERLLHIDNKLDLNIFN